MNMTEFGISPAEWGEGFCSKFWQAFRREIRQQIDTLSNTLDNEKEPRLLWEAQAVKERLQYLIEVFPEILQKDEGEIRDDRGKDGDRGTVRRHPNRPGVDF